MANILFVLVFTGLIFESVSTEHQARPGIRLRVTDKGLQYGKKYTVTLRVEKSLSFLFYTLFSVVQALFDSISFEFIAYSIPRAGLFHALIQRRREVCW